MIISKRSQVFKKRGEDIHAYGKTKKNIEMCSVCICDLAKSQIYKQVF